MMRAGLPSLRLTAVLALAALLGGCGGVPLIDSARQGPFFEPANHRGESDLGGLRRVVLLPLCAGSVAPAESAAALDPVFAAELQKQNRFEVVALTRDDFRRQFGLAEMASTAALPRDFMSVLRREYAADGVIFVDLTAYHAYRPLALGVRAKLATVEGVRLVWTFDNVFAADNPEVANSARHYYVESDRSGVPADLTPAALQSPSQFAKYVAAATFDTLPPVVALQPGPRAKTSARNR
jgi:hypothetical protein